MEAETKVYFDGNTKPKHIKKIVKNFPKASYKFGDCYATYQGGRYEATDFINACESSERVVGVFSTRP